jgi:hypothetical protein
VKHYDLLFKLTFFFQTEMVSSEYLSNQTAIEQQLMDAVRTISFPRLVGSEGEKRAQAWVKSEINRRGHLVHTQPFQTSLYRINTLNQLSNVVAMVVFLLAAWFYTIHPLLFLIPLFIIVINVYLVSTGSVEMAQPPNVPKFVKRYETENIWAEIPPKQADSTKKPLQIVFMGHYDSKSSQIPGYLRIVLYLLLLFAAVMILFGGLGGMIYFLITANPTPLLEKILWFAAILGAISGFILAFNVVGNKSPGASDNGTAVALLLGLLDYFTAHPIPNANLTFLFSGAEEVGLTGALNFIRERKDDPKWGIDSTFVINFDLAGLPGSVLINTGIGIPKKLTSKTMSLLLDKVAAEQQIPSIQLYLPVGGWTDALSFTHFGYESITFSGKSGKAHSTGDTPETIDPLAMFRTYVMAIELTRKLVADDRS